MISQELRDKIKKLPPKQQPYARKLCEDLYVIGFLASAPSHLGNGFTLLLCFVSFGLLYLYVPPDVISVEVSHWRNILLFIAGFLLLSSVIRILADICYYKSRRARKIDEVKELLMCDHNYVDILSSVTKFDLVTEFVVNKYIQDIY